MALSLSLQRFLVLSMVATTIALAVACSGNDNSEKASAPAQTLQLSMHDIGYSLNSLTATNGERVSIDLKNEGQLTHDFTIERMPMRGLQMMGGSGAGHMSGMDSMYAIHLAVDGGGDGELTFEPTEPGTYEFFCTVAGHRDAGMHGTLMVR